jgi:catechol 2,3-dioxygenase-like lactoylglutathione lyase family enzyme
MSKVSFGNHAKVTAPMPLRDKIRSFYQEVLGCKLVAAQDALDAMQFTNDFVIGIAYEADHLEEEHFLMAMWLELKTPDPDELKKKLQAFGVKEIEYKDKNHFYFHAPGGQVYRVSSIDEK